MYVTDLKEFLADFSSEEDKTRTVLIDGLWGCGKTYNTKSFIDAESKTVIYISLFGIDSKDEVALLLSEYLDSSFITTINGKCSVRSSIDEKPYCGTVIVFDDLERTGGLSFSNVCGIVHALGKIGFKVICICDLTKFDEEEELKTYIDKTFDNVISVEANSKSFPEIVPDKSFAFEKTLLDSVNGNWRIVKRAEHVYNKVLKCAKDINKEDYFLNAIYDCDSLFRICVLAVDCYFSHNTNQPIFKSQGFDAKEYAYETNVKKFGKQTANELYEIFVNKKENPSFRSGVEVLIGSMKCNNYEAFIEHSVPEKPSKSIVEPILEKEAFLLDDDGLKEYQDAFLKELNSFNFSERKEKKVLARVLSNYIDNLSEDEKNKIAVQVVKTVPTETREDFMETIFPTPLKKKSNLDVFRQNLSNLFLNKERKELDASVTNLFRQNDYEKLSTLLFQNRYSLSADRDLILGFLSERDFCLPDLSKETNDSQWRYCHEVARFVDDTAYQEAFVNSLTKQCENSPSLTLRKKCNALVRNYYGLNKDFSEVPYIQKKLPRARASRKK